MAATARLFLGRYFYFAMTLLLAAIVYYGFSHTIEENLFHGSFPRPKVLYVHAAAFSLWMVLLVVQSGLIAVARRPQWHRWLGWGGLVLGSAMPVLGVWSALRMTRLRAGFGDVDDVAFLILALWDMAAFATLFGLAMVWRARPEHHRRLILMAACVISVAGLTRFPPWLPQIDGVIWPYYAYIDALMGLAVLRDLIVLRRVHPVFRVGLPVLIAGQAVANTIYMTRPSWWMHTAEWLIR
jgi:hypothetical protein